jgi:hypothetical protein
MARRYRVANARCHQPPVRATVAAVLFLLAASGCKHEQTFDEAMHVLCDLPKTFDGGNATEFAREADRRVTNPEVRAWMQSTGVDPQQRDAKVLQMLSRAHIADCWMPPPKK